MCLQLLSIRFFAPLKKQNRTKKQFFDPYIQRTLFKQYLDIRLMSFKIFNIFNKNIFSKKFAMN